MGKKDKDKKKGKSQDIADEQDAAASIERLEDGELLSMDDAIAILKTTRPTFYRWLKAGKIRGHKVGRQWRFYPEDIQRFLKGQAPRVEVHGDIQPLIDNLSEALGDDVQNATASDSSDDVERAIDLMLAVALRRRASDIHLHPARGKDVENHQAELRLRVDGVLHTQASFDGRLLPGLLGRLKSRGGCDLNETVQPQNGRFETTVLDRRVDARLCFLPSHRGETLTLRLIRPDNIHLDLETIGFAPKDLERIRRHIHQPYGLVIFTGPPGSGKTTTAYSALQEVADDGLKIMTLETTVDYALPFAVQVPARKDPLANAQAIANSDPDVIFLGVSDFDIPDLARLKAEMASTGHLVFSQRHASSAAAALRDLLALGVDDFLLAQATRLVVAQRLVRRLCPDCRQPGQPDDEQMWRAGERAAAGGLNWETLEKTFHQPVGCDACNYGYRGHMLIAETLELTPTVAAVLRSGGTAEDIQAAAVSDGMQTMAADGIARAARGETALEEVLRALAI